MLLLLQGHRRWQQRACAALAHRRFAARSAGKSITAIAVGMAIDDGHLAGIDQPAFAFFADREPFEHDGPEKRAITISDLLGMASALDCNDWTPRSPGNEERMYRTRDWTRFALDIPIDADFGRGPGGLGRFSYCTAGAFLVGRIVERATGEPFDAYVQRRLFDPLGITDPEWTRSPSGEVQSGGQLSLTARDFAAIGRMIMNGGVHQGQRLISTDWLKTMSTARTMATLDAAYSLLWWQRGFRTEDGGVHGAIYMSGNGGNKVALFPELKTVAVILSTNYNRRDMHEQTTDILERHILPALTTGSDD
ncbi:MAG: serine hydrolase domain-containing protein [Pseudomonadota bacterium]